MLYKKNGGPRRRSYDYLHIHASSEQVHRLQKVGRVMLNGTPKKRK
jgi:hypothetical protein